MNTVVFEEYWLTKYENILVWNISSVSLDATIEETQEIGDHCIPKVEHIHVDSDV